MAGLHRINQDWGQNTDVAWIVLLCATAVLYVLGLGSPFAPTNGDEMVYIHIARLTAESGHWLPLVSDLANMRNTKPPLLFWQAMVAGGWGNNWNLLALRLPAVAYTFLTAAGVAVLTHRFSGRSSSRIRSACLAAVLYLAFFSTFRYGRVYLTSAAETFWLALPIFWLLLRANKPERKLGWIGYVLFGVAFGLGCAYKSFALVAPAAATVWLSALIMDDTRSWPGVFKTTAGLALSTVIALGIFGLWFVLDPDPAAVWSEFVVGENAGKMGSGNGYWHDALQGGASIWIQLLAYFENAGLLWFVVMGLAWTLFAVRKNAWPLHQKVLLVWLLVWLVVFTIPSQRSARYVIPAMPALAILMALLWERIHTAWFRLTLLLTVPALVMLARIGWVLNDTDIGTGFLLVAVLLCSATGLAAVLLGLFKPATTRVAALLACLCVYASLSAMVAPLSRDAANYSDTIQQQLKGAKVAVPNGFNAQYERFHFLLPQSALVPYDTDGRNTGALYPDMPVAQRLTTLLNEFDAVVWVQASLDQAVPSCAPDCKVLAQRWHVKSRHQSGEITLNNLWYPQQWLFRREWLVVGAPSHAP
jgi:4-amino-4-deoxy-L-arabinose transferase-like glycosyltransferase